MVNLEGEGHWYTRMLGRISLFIYMIISDVFEAVDVAGRSFKDIQTILERSLKNRDKTVYKYTKCFLVHNEEFLKDVRTLIA